VGTLSRDLDTSSGTENSAGGVEPAFGRGGEWSSGCRRWAGQARSGVPDPKMQTCHTRPGVDLTEK